MNSPINFDKHPQPVVQSWPEALTAREWDRRYPGIIDSLGILGGGANVIMQLSHPSVGYGVMESRVESGSVFKHPVKRTRTTLTYLAVAMMGSNADKQAYRQAVNRVHAQVYSTEKSPVKYHAMNPDLQTWVAACLYWGFADSRRTFRGPMSSADEEVFYRLARPLGTTLQVRDDMWPADLASFQQYWESGLQKAHIDDKTRAYLTALAELKFLHPITRFFFGRFNRFVTAGFLPQRLRDEMHFAWSADDQRKFDRLTAVLGFFNRLLPRAIRQLPYSALMWDFRRRIRNRLPLV